MRKGLLAAILLSTVQPCFATFHLWQIVKVYSNASGTVQYIELYTTSPDQEFVTGHAITSNGHSFTLPSDLPATLTHTTANQHLLLATPGYFAVPGVPPADYSLGVNNFFSTGGDTLNWAGVSTLTFGSGQLPTDGTNQIDRPFNTITLTTDVNSPTNFAGATGTITQPPTPRALHFVTVPPCRIADTRNPSGPFGGPSITAASSRNFIIPASACNIPYAAEAFSLNATVVPHGQLGYLSLWPTGQTQPLVSTLNSLDARVKAGAVIVPAGAGGAISAFTTNDVDLVLDINGYFVPATALDFYPVTPCRIADTRNTTGALGGPFLMGGASRVFPIRSSTCNIPATAQAYSLNLTVIPHGILGYITVWPTGQTQPLASALNALTGAVTANAAIVPAGTSGNIDVFATNDTELVIDINGYFAAAGAQGQSLYALPPCRVLDTRSGSQPFLGERDVNVVGSSCSVPHTATAYVMNATVVPTGVLGYLTLWPQGQSEPLASTLNALDSAVTSNMAIVPNITGTMSAYATVHATDLVVDIFSYFAP